MRKFSPLFYNRITYLGAFLALFIFFLELFLFALDLLSHGPNLYLGLLTYITLPPFLILGLILIPVGALMKKKRVEKGLDSLEPKTLKIDPSIPAHRNAILVFGIGTFFFVIMSLVGVYKGFQYTESVEFCGVLCHQVMSPEHTTYRNSPHGKVKCIDCHVGEGADWYVRSKMSGARQAMRAITQTYERPVQTPVHNLRPAEDTCKECHWPGKYFSTMDFKRSYFLTEEESPEWKLRMFLNVGGGGQQTHGVHAHMNIEHDIYYAAEDKKRQKITWIKSVDKSGKETIFVSPGSRWVDAEPKAEEIRKMDCIDCHNRPTHQFIAPYRLINDAMQYRKIDSSIPQIKEKAMEVLSKEYKTTDEAMIAIQKELTGYYQTEHPDFYAANQKAVDQAIAQIQKLFKNNIFPEMKTRWDIHPDNIGHLIAPGCFRCHDGEHRSLEGRVITQDCNSCHLIVEQGPAGATEKNIDGLEFKHPVDIGEDWKEAACTDCHTGGA